MNTLRFMAIGDVIGPCGVKFVKTNLWNIKNTHKIDYVIANGENAALGNGIDTYSLNSLISGGVDIVTTGNHVWQKNEIHDLLENSHSIIRPANYPAICPGMGYSVHNVMGYKVLFINLCGVVFSESGLESPFYCLERIIKREQGKFDFAIVDFHAEATSEKTALAWYADSNDFKVACVFGTHTHVQTADERILKNGTGFISDVGMTGGRDSVIGIKSNLVLRKFLTHMPVKFEFDPNNIVLNSIIFEIDTATFDTVCIKRFNFPHM